MSSPSDCAAAVIIMWPCFCRWPSLVLSSSSDQLNMVLKSQPLFSKLRPGDRGWMRGFSFSWDQQTKFNRLQIIHLIRYVLSSGLHLVQSSSVNFQHNSLVSQFHSMCVVFWTGFVHQLPPSRCSLNISHAPSARVQPVGHSSVGFIQ